jgi:hypothetical protein
MYTFVGARLIRALAYATKQTREVRATAGVGKHQPKKLPSSHIFPFDKRASAVIGSVRALGAP